MSLENLSPENESFISLQIAVGNYRDRDDAMDAAISMLRERNDLLEKLDEGQRQLDAGQYVSMNEAELHLFFEGMKQRIRSRSTQS